MKFSLFVVLSVISGTAAFVPAVPARNAAFGGAESQSRLQAYPSNDHVVKNGGGIAVVESGECRLFDPKVEGKLGGTPDLETRLRLGVQFPAQSPSSNAPGTSSQGSR